MSAALKPRKTKSKSIPTLDVSDRLLDAAGEVFAQRGYHAATIRDITKEAGVNVAAINYYFREKSMLYMAVLKLAHRAALNSDWKLEDSVAPEERLRHFIRETLRVLLDPDRPQWQAQLMAREMSSPTPMLNQLIDEAHRPKSRYLCEILQELTNGRCSEQQLSLIGSSIWGQCVVYRHSRAFVNRLFPELLKGDPIELLTNHITDFSLAALRNLPVEKEAK